LAIGFNVNYLLDALSALREENVILQLRDANSSALVREATSDKCRHVVMPLRLCPGEPPPGSTWNESARPGPGVLLLRERAGAGDPPRIPQPAPLRKWQPRACARS